MPAKKRPTELSTTGDFESLVTTIVQIHHQAPQSVFLPDLAPPLALLPPSPVQILETLSPQLLPVHSDLLQRLSQPAPSIVGDSDLAELRSLADTLHDLHRHKAAALAPIVQNLLCTRSHDVGEIEHTLDHLLDCACIPEGLALFKSLCRYYYGINPSSTASYVHAYRDMWDGGADPEQEAAP